MEQAMSIKMKKGFSQGIPEDAELPLKSMENGEAPKATIEESQDVDFDLSLLSNAWIPYIREKYNALIHYFYLNDEETEALKIIEDKLKVCKGVTEYPLYAKALIRRSQGRIKESLELFQAAAYLNPTSTLNLNQVGRSLYLLGKHRAALDIFDSALHAAKKESEWELWHNKGQCYLYLKQYKNAIECFSRANSIHRHNVTFFKLGKAYELMGDLENALETYLEALEFSPENPELLTMTGLTYLHLGENDKAFEYLGNSLTHDPRNPKTILAAGSIIQDNQDMDVALIKYRIAAVHTPQNPQLWNNIGMCFFGKGKCVAAVACLKRSLYLDPFEWIVHYNLGLVFLSTEQYASAFHYFTGAVHLHPQNLPLCLMYIGITLSRLKDFENSCEAFERALKLESEEEHLIRLNFVIVLLNNDEVERAQEEFSIVAGLRDHLNPTEMDEEIREKMDAVSALLSKCT